MSRSEFRLALTAVLLVGVGLGSSAAEAQAQAQMSPAQMQQILQNLTPEQRQRIMQQQQQEKPATPENIGPMVLTPAPPPVPAPTKSSQIEEILSHRVGHEVRQFGYDQVGVGANVTVPQTGAVQDNYVLGPGDQLTIDLRGQENIMYTVAVDRNGQITLPKLSPMSAAGRTLADFRQDLVAAVHRAYVSTEAYVTVAQLRQVSVLVTGEVANPGTRLVTGLSSPLDALLLSGGVKKSGSLRNIKLIRDGHETTIDLYGILTQTAQASLINLRDGDRILVPPLGANVAVAGFVRRPAIYELPPGRGVTNARELLALAGGPLVAGAYTMSILRLQPNGELQFIDITNDPGVQIRNGDALILRSSVNVALGRVTLTGAVRSPGAFALGRYPTLHDLLPSPDALEPGAYVLMGIIDRIDPKTMQHEAVPFSPLHVIRGSENVKLISNDAVRVLNEDDMCRILVAGITRNLQAQAGANARGRSVATLVSEMMGDAIPPNCAAHKGPPVPGMPGAEATGTLAGAGANNLAPAMPQLTGAISGGGGTAGTAPMIGVAGGTADGTTPTSEMISAGAATVAAGGLSESESALLGAELSDNRVEIGGAVNQPGWFLVAPNTVLTDALIAAHGLSEDVDLSRFELTSTTYDNMRGSATTNRMELPATPEELSQVTLKPFDSIVFRHIYSDKSGGVVRVTGQVRYPGTYDILRGERLSSVLMRAGGLTDVAYPYGTVFLRRSVAETEAAGKQKEVDDIRNQLVVAMVRPTGSSSGTLSPEAVTALQGLLNQLESQPTLGRVAIVADPAVLAAQPNHDPIMEPGDSIVIPKRPSTVSVLGQVMQPGSFPFNSSMSASDYIARAGGYSQFADSSRVIVVLPDGTARLTESSWLSFGGGGDIPPGSVIVVPRDLSALSIHQIIVDTTQIVSQLATTAAALAVLSKY